MEAFHESAMHAFEERTIADLRSTFQARFSNVSVDELRSLIRLGLVKAGSYGIDAESDVTRYLEYMVAFGNDFDTDPSSAWAKPILTADRMTGSEKMDAMDNFATFDLRHLP
jgi:hypothetical protein